MEKTPTGISSIAQGAVAGGVATMPMTVVMVASHIP